MAEVKDPAPSLPSRSPVNCGDHGETMGSQDVSSEKGPGPSGGSEEEQWDMIKAEETEVSGPGLQGPPPPNWGAG